MFPIQVRLHVIQSYRIPAILGGSPIGHGIYGSHFGWSETIGIMAHKSTGEKEVKIIWIFIWMLVKNLQSMKQIVVSLENVLMWLHDSWSNHLHKSII